MQRPVDGDVDLRLAVVGELDVIDAADGGAADQDLIALDELPAGLEEEPVVVSAAAPGDQEDDDRDDDQGQRAERGQPGESAAPSYARALRRDSTLGRGHVRPAYGADRSPAMSVRSGPYDGPFLQQLLTCFPAALSPAAILQLHARSYLGPPAADSVIGHSFRGVNGCLIAPISTRFGRPRRIGAAKGNAACG